MTYSTSELYVVLYVDSAADGVVSYDGYWNSQRNSDSFLWDSTIEVALNMLRVAIQFLDPPTLMLRLLRRRNN